MGVSLVYVEENPVSALANDEAWRRDGAEIDPDERAPPQLATRRLRRTTETDGHPEPLEPAQHQLATAAAENGVRVDRRSVRVSERSGATGAASEDREQARTYVAGVSVDVGQTTPCPEAAVPSAAVTASTQAAQPARTHAVATAEDETVRGVHPRASVFQHGQRRQQQDREAAIRRIHERIRKVMPLVYWEPSRRNERVGRAVVRFQLTQVGYVSAFEVVDSSGDLQIDDAARTVLHLAEPYVYVPGWIELALTFRG